MKTGMAHKLTLCVLIAGLLFAGGCAYTTVTQETLQPDPGPVVKTGVSAVMPQVADKRSWPRSYSEYRPTNNVRLFAKQISNKLRTDLVRAGLFTALHSPDEPAAAEITDKLSITFKTFKLAKQSYNSMLLPHLLADGLFLPFFAVTAVASKGEVDLGGYYIPSSTAATTIAANVIYEDLEQKAKILSRSYSIQHTLGRVSDSDLREGIVNKGAYGAKLGKQEGLNALDSLVEKIIRDPYWAYLEDYRSLIKAEKLGIKQSPLEEKIEAVNQVMGLLRPIAYSDGEVAVIRDTSLTAGKRASILNDLRSRRFGKELAEDEKVTEEQVEAMFNDHLVDRSEVESKIATRVIKLAMLALTPSEAVKAKEEAATDSQAGPAASGAKADSQAEGSAKPEPKADSQAGPGGGKPKPGPQPGSKDAPAKASQADDMQKIIKAERTKKRSGFPPDPPDAAAQRTQLIKGLALKFKNRPQLTKLLLIQADITVGKQWPLMAALLAEVGSNQTKQYLENRGT